ncbi:MAG TPA: phosphotriesterase, partial [Pseudonocardia sp.]
MTSVRTVLGDIRPDQLGLCDAHDHLFMTSAALPGEELTDRRAAERELGRFAELGGGALVQWTPFGMGRDPDGLAELSRRTGVHLVAATGMHRVAHNPPGLPERLYDRLAELFVGELTEGMRTGDDPDGPIASARAGMIKVAGDFHGISEHTRRT